MVHTATKNNDFLRNNLHRKSSICDLIRHVTWQIPCVRVSVLLGFQKGYTLNYKETALGKMT